MSEANDWNQKVIEEFRANGGKVGGPFSGASMILLTTTGAKSGRRHTTPLVYQKDGDRIVVFGSKGGAPSHPAWFHNLVANPDVTIEVKGEKIPVRARVPEADERKKLYAAQAAMMPAFADYQTKTKRKIPVIVLKRKA